MKIADARKPEPIPTFPNLCIGDVFARVNLGSGIDNALYMKIKQKLDADGVVFNALNLSTLEVWNFVDEDELVTKLNATLVIDD